MNDETALDRHYETGSLQTRIDDALKQAGLADKPIAWTDLAPMDQFHSRGLAATQELGQALSPREGTAVLDVGCGIGGSSRYLAATFGCNVTGIDLNASFIEVAESLSERAGLSGKTTFRQADALDLPFDDGTFDDAWTQHVSMNIKNRSRFYSEIHRVLKPGGRLAIHDIVGGNGEPLHFPVPWASTPDFSYLLTGPELREELERSGFRIDFWADITDVTVAWQRDRVPTAPSPSAQPGLGLHLVMGAEFPRRVGNMGRNLAEGRARVLQAIARRS